MPMLLLGIRLSHIQPSIICLCKSGIETLQINGQNGNEIVMIIAITCAKLKNPTGPSHAMRVLAERCYKVSIDVRASARNKKAKRGGT